MAATLRIICEPGDEWPGEGGVIAMPGSFLELPGYFRLSLTATDEMIERSLPAFARAIERAH